VSELFRVSGAGNDFLALVDPANDPPAERIRAWCRRGVSLGADGVFTLRQQRHDSRVAMTYWNADGGEAALCVNATRCAAQLAFFLGWAEREVTVETGAGPFAARRLSDREIELEMAPASDEPQPVTLDGPDLAAPLAGWSMTVGVPHAVLPWDGELGDLPIEALGPAVRRHPLFPHGANANFVRTGGAHEIDIRTWERGVEGETLACGSGVLAAVATGVFNGQLALPVRARTRGGFVLTVGGQVESQQVGSQPAGSQPGEGNRIARWTMAGDARVLACAEVFAGADVEIEAPAWS